MAAQRIDLYNRLETRRGERDIDNGFAARLHDPLWFLARQWQMGEHQGENASTPVRVDVEVTRSPILPLDGEAAFDPRIVPAEALVESELEDWWTMGRRIRAGHRIASLAPDLIDQPQLVFQDPPPPYQAFAGRLDGLAVWLIRDRLGVQIGDFGGDLPPRDSPDRWESRELSYGASFDSPVAELKIRDHRGGSVDWYSADADEAAAQGETPEAEAVAVIPTPLEYPGAPHSRFWEIEDAQVDIGGYAPDTAHFATMLLVDLIYSHSDDWFLVPVNAEVGSVVSIDSMKVTDGFGQVFDGTELLDDGTPVYPGLSAPDDFSLYRCTGLPASSLVVWPVAEGPLESQPIERVQFGLDEQSNVLWALERIVDGRAVARKPIAPNAAHPAYPPLKPSGDLSKAKTYAYKPADGVESHWHPYQLDWSAEGGPAYLRGGMADYGLQQPRPTPHPGGRLLYAGTPEAPELHSISAGVMAGGGFELKRRWQLARGVDGRPVLWVERQRHILRSPPARNVRFDVLEESGEE
ncbi:hypothetical protein QBK99_12770 [Corticibacterium sp. UT-5YL-CI-8]|nr:hypothetical protein [Tianweitania sp. UT-5YL-CI-8]